MSRCKSQGEAVELKLTSHRKNIRIYIQIPGKKICIQRHTYRGIQAAVAYSYIVRAAVKFRQKIAGKVFSTATNRLADKSSAGPAKIRSIRFLAEKVEVERVARRPGDIRQLAVSIAKS